MTILDLAGGEGGGAGRFRAQYLRYADARSIPAGAVLGLDEHVTPSWLVRRERLAQGSTKAIAANNVGFVRAGYQRWTLLRNANHFLTPTEWEQSADRLGRGFSIQAKIVRLTARRSELLIVPSSSMADRVATALPRMAERIVVRHHPLHVPARTTPLPGAAATILCPIVNSPYKNLVAHLELLRTALGDRAVRVVCTITPDEASAALRSDSRFVFRGMLDRAALGKVYDSAWAVYFPTSIESFGYPLAEARAAGMPVIAQENAHNREIAGGALFGYTTGNVAELGEAIDGALTTPLTPDPEPFAPSPYFDWLLA